MKALLYIPCKTWQPLEDPPPSVNAASQDPKAFELADFSVANSLSITESGLGAACCLWCGCGLVACPPESYLFHLPLLGIGSQL